MTQWLRQRLRRLGPAAGPRRCGSDPDAGAACPRPWTWPSRACSGGGTGFYRTELGLAAGRRGRLCFGACSIYSRIIVMACSCPSTAPGYMLYGWTWRRLPPRGVWSADNRNNRTTAPVHTGGDFFEYGGLTRSVLLPGAFVESFDTVPLRRDAGGAEAPCEWAA